MNKDIPQLVQDFLDGDPKAFETLVDRFKRKIYSLAFQVLGNHLDADEVVQETFVRVYRKREELKDVKYFSSFIIRIATNYSIDLLRKRRGHSGMPDDSASLPGGIQLDLARRVATPSEDFEKKRLMEEVYRALEQLPPRQKLTAILHDVEGYSKAEIARTFDCPEATVRSNLHIARTKIKKILKQRLKSKE
ncbi:MAG: RNA polymerase sigma factor [Candidatus Zixiibacteriota bacterium]|nr:MAG: RNA polymerase sigma factor [candidate division Zixibacteria bacterium]